MPPQSRAFFSFTLGTQFTRLFDGFLHFFEQLLLLLAFGVQRGSCERAFATLASIWRAPRRDRTLRCYTGYYLENTAARPNVQKLRWLVFGDSKCLNHQKHQHEQLDWLVEDQSVLRTAYEHGPVEHQ